MNTRMTLAAVFFLSALPASLSAAIDPESSPKPTHSRDSRKANCLLRITGDPGAFPLNEHNLTALLKTSGVKGQAAHEALGVSDDRTLEAIVGVTLRTLSEPEPGAEISLLIVRLSVDLEGDGEMPDVRPAAAEFLEALCHRLKAALELCLQDHARTIGDEVAAQRGELDRTTAMLMDGLQKKRAMLLEAEGFDLDREFVEATIRELNLQRRNLEMERIAHEARRAAIERQIARLAEKATQQIDENQALAEQAKVVEIQQKRMERVKMLVSKSVASQEELLDAQEALAQAKAELGRLRIEISTSTGSGLLASLTGDLARLTIEGAERDARLSFVKTQLKRADGLMDLVPQYEREVALKLPVLREAVAEQTRRLHALQHRLRVLQEPRMTVIGSD